MRRTSPEKEQLVITSILMGEAYSVVSMKTGIPVSTIKKIKKRSDINMAHLHGHIAQKQADSVEALLRQTNQQIAKLLAKAEVGLIDISVNDLCSISNAMHAQTLINSTPTRPLKTLTNIMQKYQ